MKPNTILPLLFAAIGGIHLTGCQSNTVYFGLEPRRGVERVPTDGGTPKVLASQFVVLGMAVSPARNKMYATLQDSIWEWSLLDGSNEQLLLRVGIADCMALDETAGRIYWGDQKRKHIASSNLQGADVRVLVTGVNFPEVIAVNPKLGWLYWGHESPSGGVWRARLDGTEQRLLSAETAHPTALAVDSKSGQIFWALSPTFGLPGRIMTASFDGSGAQEIISDPDAFIEGLALDNGKSRVVWIERRRGGGRARIRSAQFDGSSAKTIHEFAGADYARSLTVGPPRNDAH